MAILGRLACSLCGFEAAHVKQNPHKLPYQHCPDCGAMLSTKSKHQARLMLDKMRPIDPAEASTSMPAAAGPAPTSMPSPVAATPPVPTPAARAPKSDFWTRMAGKVA